ncbi:uncharacterized protein LOC106723162 isoform X2 [Alligator sinensis]|uniref:Uncharacterized protein LOC106723162 isoform X2 n=1 Tax=Alligator sinensis TaxID=38654 RepID=A0A3Q0FSQ2_ALLSI|nr:uncharacterized protein LOC106723162 isoform X2 [Alligator sinensis]
MANMGGWTDIWALRLGGLLLPLLFLGTAGSQLQVTTAPSSWAHLGSRSLLQCRFDVGGPVALDFLRVQWYIGEHVVACYNQGRIQAQPGASLPSEKELETGDASLSLAVVTPWDKGVYKCVVWHRDQEHQGMTTLHLLAAPMISILRQPAEADTETSLLCHVGGFFPEDVDVVWLRDGQVLKGFPCSSPQRNLDGTFTFTMTYTFTPTHKDAGSVFSCRVHHMAPRQPLQEDIPLDIGGSTEVDHTSTMISAVLGIGIINGIVVIIIMKQKSRSSGQLQLQARPQVSEIQVLPEWDPRDKVPFAVQLHNFYPREVPPIQWGCDGIWSWGEDPAQIDNNADGTFTATSIWRVPTWSLTRPELRVRVRVQHGPGEPPSERELSLRAAGLLRPPDVSEITQPESMATGMGVTLSCRIAGHFPGELSVTWLRRGKGEDTAAILEDSAECRVEPGMAVLARDGKSFQQQTGLTCWMSRDQGEEYICRVDHLALQAPIERSINDPGPAPVGSPVLRAPGWAVSYSVSEVQGPERCRLGQEVTLSCSMEGTFPEDVAVTWERIHSEDRTVPEIDKEQESPEHQPLLPALPPGWRVTEERAGTCLTSSLTFTPTLQDDGTRVRCVFLHEVESIREERVSPEIQVWARPQVSEIQVLPEWDPRDKVPFAVQLHNFYPREVPPIQWGCDGIWSWGEDLAQVDNNADGTFTTTSIWRLPSWSLTRPELRVRVRVCVPHGPGEPPSERELSLRAAGLLRPPDVSEISQPESVAKVKGVTLSCRIAGHFPGELSVTWLRRGKGEDTAVILRDSAECRVEPGTAVLARDGKSFQQETRLTRWTSRDQGAEYICRVGHLALETPIESSSACHLHPPDLGEVSQTQALIPEQLVTMKTRLSGCNPKQLAMTWLGKKARKKEPRALESSDPQRIHTSTPSQVPDRKSYSVESEQHVPTTGPEDKRVEYQSCVKHEALKKSKSRSSGLTGPSEPSGVSNN